MTTLLEYIWIDGYGNLRSKTKVLKVSNVTNIDMCPEWNYDGSSTGQATGSNSEVIIKPCYICPDPFRGNNHKLVLCDTYLSSGVPHETNKRVKANKLFNDNLDDEPLFGIEQEFFLVKDGYPIGFPSNRNLYPSPQKNYYCGIGSDNSIGRECIEKAFNNCIKAGLNVTGLNAEVAPSQWEIQICAKGIEASDQLYIMRYILDRTAEEYGWSIDINPKPIEGDWNGSGCHVNFSTKKMREENGYNIILNSLDRLSKNHDIYMKYYGEDNDKRMTGKHETASFDKFSSGVGNRGASVRIPTLTFLNKKGYFEDRRPSSNMNPYIVTSLLMETTINDNISLSILM